MQTADYQQQMVTGIADGIDSTLRPENKKK